MRIIMSSNNSWNLYNFRKNLILELIKEKNEVIIISNPDKYTQLIIDMGCKFYPVYFNRKNRSPIELLKIFFIYFYKFYILKPDVYLSFTIKPNIIGSIAAKFFKIKVINNITGLGTTFIKKNFSTFFIIFLYKIAIKNSNKIFFHNIEDIQLFKKNKIIKSENTDVIPGSGVDLNKFSYSEINFELPFSFLYLGRLIRDKGINEYIKACIFLKSKYSKINFYIIGSPDKENLTNLSNFELNNLKENKAIEFLGFSPKPQDIIKKITCIVLPSYREGLSKSLMEACAVGRPIVTTNVPGCREIVTENKNGFLALPKNTKSLIECMEKIISLEKFELMNHSLYSRDLAVKNFDEKIVIDKYLQVLNIK